VAPLLRFFTNTNKEVFGFAGPFMTLSPLRNLFGRT
jgi:hypothetical protein